VVGPGAASIVENVVSPKEVALESLSYTASEVVGRGGSSPKPNRARGPKSGVGRLGFLEETVSRRLVTPRFPP
jgi:hypothetical protein